MMIDLIHNKESCHVNKLTIRNHDNWRIHDLNHYGSSITVHGSWILSIMTVTLVSCMKLYFLPILIIFISVPKLFWAFLWLFHDYFIIITWFFHECSAIDPWLFHEWSPIDPRLFQDCCSLIVPRLFYDVSIISSLLLVDWSMIVPW